MNRTHEIAAQSAGFLHPGQMGVSIASAAASGGAEAFWASQGRSAETAYRAAQSGLNDLLTVEALCKESHHVFSICPPDQAVAVAHQVAETGFEGIYTDCNAVSPVTAKQVERIVTRQGATYVDGGIIGPPAIEVGTTRLYLSGKSAEAVAELFTNTNVDARAIGCDSGAASALKMAYAGWTKGSAALLMTQFAFARQSNVEATLLEEWALSQPGLGDKLEHACSSSAPKAWRFVGEMLEIVESLDASGLPGSWFTGAADVYQRLDGLKNTSEPGRDKVIDALLVESDKHRS